LAAAHAAADFGGDGMGKFELLEHAVDIVARRRIGGKHIVQRAPCSVVLSLYFLDRLFHLIRIGGRITFVNCGTE
jgi:hypothetical protein